MRLLQNILMQGVQAERVMTEEGCFQSADKETAIETVSFSPGKTFSHGFAREGRRKEEVAWKVSQCKNAGSYAKRSSYRLSKNISFEDGEKYSEDEDQEDECSAIVEPEESSFAAYYRDHDALYHKSYNFGSSWIGRRQYYASTFITPASIETRNLQFNPQGDTNHDLNHDTSKAIAFDSDFQSGNLLAVFRVNQNEYDLILQNDVNTKGNTQWFYFRITNPPKGVGVKLNIVNMRKPDSLFNYGMKPCVLSLKEQEKNGKGWFREGRSIKYFKNDHQIQHSKRYYYTLAFTISTPHQNDTIKIAQSFPYTYTDLNNYLDSLERVKYKKEIMEREVIATTIAKNKLEVITVREYNGKVKIRPLIVVIARQHPGQTPGSFVCEGLLDYLLGKDKESDFLRKNYEIKVVPMMNPDGVIAGNYRTNLQGHDLNRRWDGTKFRTTHEASHVKKYIAQLSKGREVAFVLDLHGHSRKMFSFFYGNPNPASPLDARLFPLISAKLNPTIRFEDCTFATEDDKRNTARVQFGLMLKCVNIFTFESSFFGSLGREREKRHYKVEDYKQMGRDLVKAMYIHERGKEIYDSTPDHRDIFLYKKAISELKNDAGLLTSGDKENSGSESCPQECELKESEGLKIELNQQGKQRQTSKNIKNIKKINRKEMVRLPSRSQRQMQVMDIAQVNSMFPSNLLALIPASFLAKKKKAQTCSKMVQTDSTPLVRIYETCKQQDSKLFYNHDIPLHARSQLGSPQKRTASNLLKSNILSRPHSESQNREMLSSIGLSKGYQSKEKETKSLIDKHHKKTLSCSSAKQQLSRESQTVISFNCMNLGQIRSKLQKEILDLKTIDPTFTSFNYNKLQPKSIAKTSSINVLQSLKLRKRQRI